MMISTDQKADFLQNDYLRLLGQLDPSTPPRWGKMNVQQMIEHMSDSVRIANGKDPKDCIHPPEIVEKMVAFIRSDKPFRENTANAQLPETPLPERQPSVEDAISELKVELADFTDVFDNDKHRLITNPFFGDLDYELWVLLLYKHAWHHLRQFGIAETIS